MKYLLIGDRLSVSDLMNEIVNLFTEHSTTLNKITNDIANTSLAIPVSSSV